MKSFGSLRWDEGAGFFFIGLGGGGGGGGVYTAQTVYLLGPEQRASLNHATPLYTALGDTVKKVVEFTAESITSRSNLVRSFQIRCRILLKLQISEQTPLM